MELHYVACVGTTYCIKFSCKQM